MENYLRSKFVDWLNMKPMTELDYRDEFCIKKIENRTLNKSLLRIQHIIKMINNLKIGISKKYHVSGYHDAKIIKKYCDDLHIKCEIEEDNKITKNKIDVIVGGKYFCCDECDESPYFKNKKVPVIYVKITKK